MDLFIDTSGRGVRLISMCEEKPPFAVYDSEARGEALSEWWKKALETQGVTPKELQSITVVNGPGSFTGIRVGLAFAMGLAMATSVPLYQISGLGLWAADRVPETGAFILSALPGHWFVAAGCFHSRKGRFEFEKRLSLSEIRDQDFAKNLYGTQVEEDFPQLKVLEYPSVEFIFKLKNRLTPASLTEIQANYLQASSAEKMLG